MCNGPVQGANINGYNGDHDEEDLKEEWSSVSTLKLSESPRPSSVIAEANSPALLSPSLDDSHYTMPSGTARSACTMLLWAVFPCKCMFLPWLRQKGKKKQKQPEWATGYEGREDEKIISAFDGLHSKHDTEGFSARSTDQCPQEERQ